MPLLERISLTKLSALCFSVLTALFFTSGAEARDWTIVGPRALGMGGANVAVANDSTASYWNPAAFGFFKNDDGGDYGKRKWSGAADAGIGARIHEDLGEQLNRIMDFDFSTLGGNVPAAKVPDFLLLVNELKLFEDNENSALTINFNAAASAQASHYGFGTYVFADISARGDLDLVNIAPGTTAGANIITELSTAGTFGSAPAGDYYFTAGEKAALISQIEVLAGWNTTTATDFIQAVDYGLSQAPASTVIPADIAAVTVNVATVASAAGTGNTFDTNTSSLLFKGIAVAEFPITFGYAVTDDFAIGGNIKYMKARVYNTEVPVFNTDFGDALDTATDSYMDSSNFGVDVGLLYRFGDDLRVGLVGRNINSPSFDMLPLLAGDADHVTEDVQLRAGVAYKPLNFVTLAVDMDLIENDTTVSGSYKSRNLGGGVEVSLLNVLQLRAGAYKNMAESDIGVVYTAGLGLNLWAVNLDLGASMASETTTVDTSDLPKEVKVEAALSMLF